MAYFVAYSFLGWLVQSLYLSLKSCSPVNAGFMLLPLCPIYGFSMVFLIILAYPHGFSFPMLFLTCFVTVLMIEYYTSLIFDLAFHVLLWDYSNHKLSLNGRTTVLWSALWGAAAALTLTFFHPILENLRVPNWIPNIIFAIIIIMHIDFRFSVNTVLRLNDRLADMTKLRKRFIYYSRQSNACDGIGVMLPFNRYMISIINSINHKGIFLDSYSDIPAELLAASLALIKTRYTKLCNPSFAERRLLRAFNTLQVHEETESLAELRQVRVKDI